MQPQADIIKIFNDSESTIVQSLHIIDDEINNVRTIAPDVDTSTYVVEMLHALADAIDHITKAFQAHRKAQVYFNDHHRH